MNTDIRLSCGFWSHPKTKRLVKRLGLDGVRSLQILWLWAAQERPSGCLSGMDAEDIELAADWNGEDGLFFGECLGRWIDEGEDGFCLHDWEDHNAWASEADNRSDTARLSRLARVNKEAAAGLRADGRTGITKEEYRLYAEGTTYERRTTVPTTPAPSPTLRKENNRVSPLPPSGGGEATNLPPSPEDDPDAQPCAEISSLNDCVVEFQDLAALYQQAGGNVDVVPAYKAYEGIRKKFPLRQIELDLEKRKLCDQWQRGKIPKLSNYLRDRVWLNAITARASPAPQPRTYQDQQQAQRAEKAKRLKQELMGGAHGTDHGNTGQEGARLVQHAPRAITAEDGR